MSMVVTTFVAEIFESANARKKAPELTLHSDTFFRNYAVSAICFLKIVHKSNHRLSVGTPRGYRKAKPYKYQVHDCKAGRNPGRYPSRHRHRHS